MSSTSKFFLGSSFIITGGTIAYVHYKQNYDRSKLREGVVMDVQRQQMKKSENMYKLQQQIDLAKQLKRDLE